MKITLSRAVDELEDALDSIDPETGEIGEGYESARNLVQYKTEACIAYVMQSDAYAELLKRRAKELTEQAASIIKRKEWLETYLKQNMSRVGITEIKANDGSFIAKFYPERDESLDAFQEELIPEEYFNVVVTKKLDKIRLKKEIKAGKEIQGARIVKKDRLVIK